jgi:hypothetical protein
MKNFQLSPEAEAFYQAARALAETNERAAKKALLALKDEVQSSKGVLIKWRLRYYDGDATDGERDWRGYVNGIEMYRVMRGCWFATFDRSELGGDSCTSERQGKAICLAHLLSTLVTL